MPALKAYGNTEREEIGKILEEILDQNPKFLGVYTCWEPNALDGRDREYANTRGHDATGRYIPYYNRGSGKIILEPLVDYDKEGAGDYYMIPKKTKTESIIDPYLYSIAGKETLLTSMVAPIIIKGKFVGIAGIDIALSDIQDIISKIKPYETGIAALFSNSGIVAGHFDPERLGKNLLETEKDIMGPHISELADTIKNGKSTNMAFFAEVLKQEIYLQNQPITIGRADKTPWSIFVGIPMDRILKEINMMTVFSVIIAVVASLLLSAIIFFIARSISNPLSATVKIADAISSGDLTVKADTTHLGRSDEIGMLSRAFSNMLDRLREVMEKITLNAESLATASFQMNSTSQSLSSSANEQAANVEEITSSLEEIGANIAQNTKNARNTDAISKEAVSKAIDGGKAVSNTVKAMNNIKEKITLIEDIAYQTNLLALNAAIEAARAGETRKGVRCSSH